MLALVLSVLCSLALTDVERDALVRDAAAIDCVALRSDDFSDIYDDLSEQGYALCWESEP